jgi:hypothetical protein
VQKEGVLKRTYELPHDQASGSGHTKQNQKGLWDSCSLPVALFDALEESIFLEKKTKTAHGQFIHPWYFPVAFLPLF